MSSAVRQSPVGHKKLLPSRDQKSPSTATSLHLDSTIPSHTVYSDSPTTQPQFSCSKSIPRPSRTDIFFLTRDIPRFLHEWLNSRRIPHQKADHILLRNRRGTSRKKVLILVSGVRLRDLKPSLGINLSWSSCIMY